eukprot:353125-Chlamydomonas_euryale.AAC.7
MPPTHVRRKTNRRRSFSYTDCRRLPADSRRLLRRNVAMIRPLSAGNARVISARITCVSSYRTVCACLCGVDHARVIAALITCMSQLGA